LIAWDVVELAVVDAKGKQERVVLVGVWLLVV
jgi:hypothetical protein